MRILAAIVLAALLAPACAILPRPVPEGTPPECVWYDDQSLAWQAVGASAAGLATLTGTAGAGIAGAGIDDADEWGIGLGAAGGVLGVLAAVAGLLAGEYAARIAGECGP